MANKLLDIFADDKIDGTRAWLVCVGAFMAHFVALGTVYSFGVLLIPISLDFQVGRGTAAWIGSVAVSTMLLFSSVAGYLGARYGYSVVTWVGGLMIAVFHIVTSFMPNIYPVFITYGVFVGIGISCTFMPGYAAVGQWFAKYRGLATGIAVAGSGVGNLVYPFILEQLLARLTDWRSALRCIGLIDLLGAVIAGFLVTRRVKEDGSKQSLTNIRPILEDRAAWLIALFNLIINFGWLVPSIHLAADAEDQGYSALESSLLLSILGIASTAGRVIFGYLSDWLGKKWTILFSAFGMGLSTLLWPALTLLGYAGFCTYAVLYGLVSGSVISCLAPLIADYFGTEYLGILSGLAFAFSAVGGLLGPPIAGFIYDATGDYTISAYVAGGIMTLGACVTIFFPRDGTHKLKGYEVITRISQKASDTDEEGSVPDLQSPKSFRSI